MILRGMDGISMRRMALAALALLAASPVCAQYLGQLTKQAKDAPELRAIAVLEWTGPEGKPKASRLVPVAVLDSARIEGGQLQDGGIYLARPEPLALTGEVEYELERNGKPMGLFEIENAGQEQGSWVGYGAWKPLPAVRPKPSTEQLANVGHDDEESDQPVLHRKKHPGDAPTGDKDKTSSGGAGSGNGSSSEEPAPDPDRPVLHKKDSNGSAASSPAPADDPDRPVLKKTKKKQPEDVAHVDSLPDITDPDRPRLRRGQATGDALSVVPSLMGLPPDLEQAVAVSDAKSRPPHPWSYSWSDQDDEAKMKSELEEIARDALGLNPPPAPKQAARRKQAGKGAKPAPPPPASAPLVDEQFRVFELAYGSGATLVLTAHIDAPRTQMKFVTLIAQPDLYGNVLVLLKSVADGGHLDEAPRMRLVDAVDALADNRGELLFELRGATQRQFALYRILRGQAEKLFVTGGGEFGSESRE